MRPRALTSLLLAGMLLIFQSGVMAFETDQYNLPPRPLADIGDEVTEHVEQKLRQAIEKLNAEISTHQTASPAKPRRARRAAAIQLKRKTRD